MERVEGTSSVRGVIEGHYDSVFAVASSESGRPLLASGGADDKGILLDPSKFEPLAETGDMGESVVEIAFSFDSKYCAFGAMNGKIVLMTIPEEGDEVTREELEEVSDEAVEFLDWHPRGSILLVGSADGICRMYNADTRRIMTLFIGHSDAVTCGGFSADGKTVATASADGWIKVWNPRDGVCRYSIRHTRESSAEQHNADEPSGDHGSPSGVVSLCIGKAEHTNKLVAAGSEDGSVSLSNFETGRKIADLSSHNGSVETIAISGPQHNPPILATGGTDGEIHTWDIQRSISRSVMKHDAAVTKLRWHPVRHQIISSSIDGTVRIWDARDGSKVKELTGHTDGVLDVCIIHRNGETKYATASDDHRVLIHAPDSQ